ncbi:Glycosyl transferase family 2 [Austwickia chelonae]|uniref:Glycosyltransferase 2-like domain-containing protein n=1 Tax=Austwickia chelonae NBRC 105200 TaxID=1184607 RepID=K6VVT8_9MICO|nr:glycosyltransferase family 2 protein [Austwickia chelonae]GAB79455.1 hypothetical protein AUCHE_26_00060 [Austwickia chelonae NBRC 105200]SEV88170.1 Glycosyl transferase family 2 [Austwickia chelonae]
MKENLDPAPPGRISACLIARDEATRIGRCLDSLRFLGRLLHEVVVYDTGSVDDTREVAAESGTIVITGYWDDDFSRARNAGIEAATGDWALIVDADEEIVVDVDALAVQLRDLPAEMDGLACWVINLDEDGEHTERSRRCGLFRRDRLRYRGAIHESPRTAEGGSPAVQAVGEDVLQIWHHGYRDRTYSVEKVLRNAAIADVEISRLRSRGSTRSDELAWALFHRARSRLTEQERPVAAAEYREVIGLTQDASLRQAALECLMDVHLDSGEHDEAAHCLDALVRTGAPGSYAWWGAVRVAVGLQDLETAEAILAGIDTVETSLGVQAPRHYLWEARAQVAEALGKRSEALAYLLTSMVQTGQVEGKGPWLLRLWDGSIDQLTELVRQRAASPDQVQAVLRELAKGDR